jgi:hypothetical protein
MPARNCMASTSSCGFCRSSRLDAPNPYDSLPPGGRLVALVRSLGSLSVQGKAERETTASLLIRAVPSAGASGGSFRKSRFPSAARPRTAASVVGSTVITNGRSCFVSHGCCSTRPQAECFPARMPASVAMIPAGRPPGIAGSRRAFARSQIPAYTRPAVRGRTEKRAPPPLRISRATRIKSLTTATPVGRSPRRARSRRCLRRRGLSPRWNYRRPARRR